MQDIRAAAPLVVQALQQWYGADPHGREVGLYSYDDPALATQWGDWHSLSRIGRNLINTGLAVFGVRNRRQDMSRWWNSANAITAVIGYMSATGDRSYLAPVVENTFTKAPGAHRPVKSRALRSFGGKSNAYTGFINGFYDDEGWWALAWLDAYDLTGDEMYLAAADDILKDMTTAWDDVLGGGIYWGKCDGSPDRAGVSAIPRGWTGHPYKNAIANELFIAVAAGLALRYRRRDPAGTGSAECQQWAVRCWEWFSSPPPHGVAMINEAGLVNDSPNKQGKNDNTESVWSYNQGVILTGLADLTELTGDANYLGGAEKIADAFIKSQWYVVRRPGPVPPPSQSGVINGILHEHNDCNPDGSGPLKSGVLPGVDTTMFKGIFVRNLARLYLKTRKESYAQFIMANAESALSHRNERHQFGGNWAAPPDTADFVRQTAGLDLINAALLVSG
jgi:predicted alpha-1,6-mannanase (GH76 family)